MVQSPKPQMVEFAKVEDLIDRNQMCYTFLATKKSEQILLTSIAIDKAGSYTLYTYIHQHMSIHAWFQF
jgi:hypothetical protein